MDLKIVAACNELIGTKSKTLTQRVDHTNERARLRRELDHQKRQLDKRLASLRVTKDLSVYREACTTVFDEAGIRIPGLAAARQAQLCLHVHILTVLDNQHELLKKQGHRERTALEVQSNRVRDSIATCEIHYLNQMVQLEQQLQELQEWIQTTESTKTLASKRNKLNRSAHEKQEQQQEQEDQTASDQDTIKPGQEPLHSSLHDRTLKTADSSESDERTAQSTPPSLSPDGPVGPRPTTERRGSVGMKGSCIMPARPQYLMMGPSKQSVAASTTTASSAIPSLAATPTVQLMHHPDDDDDDDDEENDHTQIHEQKDISSSLSSSLPSYETTTTTSHNENGPPAIVAT